MKIEKGMKSDAFIELMTKVHTSADEATALRALEQSGKSTEFKEALLALDRKERLKQLKDLKGVDQKKLSPNAFRVMTSLDQAALTPARWQKTRTWAIETLIPVPFKEEYYTPLAYSGAYVSNAMTGPNKPDPKNFDGIMGVVRAHNGEYTVSNPGDPSWGKTRVSISGQVSIDYSGVLPRTGNYSLYLDSNLLLIKGFTRVIGEGDSTCSYDAKVWVRLGVGVEVAGTLVDYSDEQIHYDGTRSENRGVNFNEPRLVEYRSVNLTGNAGDAVKLKFLLDIEASANREGLAAGVVDTFGFVANTPEDYMPAVVGHFFGPPRS